MTRGRGLLLARRSIAGSGIGGIAETQQMLDYCATRGSTSDVEVSQPDQINRPTSECCGGT